MGPRGKPICWLNYFLRFLEHIYTLTPKIGMPHLGKIGLIVVTQDTVSKWTYFISFDQKFQCSELQAGATLAATFASLVVYIIYL